MRTSVQPSLTSAFNYELQSRNRLSIAAPLLYHLLQTRLQGVHGVVIGQWISSLLLILSGLALGAASPAAGQALSHAQIAAIDAAAARVLDQTGVPAASIAIVRGGRIVYTQAYGFERPGRPARTETRYAIGSISKQFTAAAIIMLADQGKLSLDDKVGKYFPGLTRADEVTIRQILAHTAGYRDYWPQDYVFEDMTHPVAPAAILDRWARQPLDFEPASRWQYSNTGYVLAGLIVEKVSGTSLDRFLQDRVFSHLGMKPSDYDTPAGADRAPAYDRNASGPVREVAPTGAGWSFATGHLVMTASDLARWDISVINRSLMSAQAYATQQREQVLSNGLGTNYGLGVDVEDARGHRRIAHGGGQTGFLTENRIYPDDGTAIVVLDNAGFGNAQLAIADAIEEQLFADDSGVGRARELYDMMRSGRVDRSQFTDNGNFFLTPVVLADYQASLASLPEPTSVTQTQSGLRGGLTSQRFLLVVGDRKLQITLRAEPGAQGKVEEFKVTPVS